MPRIRSIDRPVQLCLKLPESVYAQLTMHLFSPLEGRVPFGKYQEFFIERIREFFAARRLDLSPYGMSGMVIGPQETIEMIEQKLKGGP